MLREDLKWVPMGDAVTSPAWLPSELPWKMHLVQRPTTPPVWKSFGTVALTMVVATGDHRIKLTETGVQFELTGLSLPARVGHDRIYDCDQWRRSHVRWVGLPVYAPESSDLAGVLSPRGVVRRRDLSERQTQKSSLMQSGFFRTRCR